VIAEMPPVLVHGDLWIANVLWNVKADGTASDDVAAIIDWQTATPGNPVVDVLRFLWSSVEGRLFLSIVKTLKL
jgi:aminoglycoside phosphotransferase (APT) family kinase protein